MASIFFSCNRIFREKILDTHLMLKVYIKAQTLKLHGNGRREESEKEGGQREKGREVSVVRKKVMSK